MVAGVCNMCGIIVTLSICFCPRDRKSINVGRCDSSRDLHIFSASSQPPTLWGLTRHVVNRQLGSSLSLTRTDMHQRKAKVKRSHGRSQLPAVELLVFFPSVYMCVPHRKSLQRSMINPERRFLPSSLYYLSPRIFRTRNDTHRTAHVVTLRALYRLLYIYIYIYTCTHWSSRPTPKRTRERESQLLLWLFFSERATATIFFALVPPFVIACTHPFCSTRIKVPPLQCWWWWSSWLSVCILYRYNIIREEEPLSIAAIRYIPFLFIHLVFQTICKVGGIIKWRVHWFPWTKLNYQTLNIICTNYTCSGLITRQMIH